MKILDFALNICTGLGVMLALFTILIGILVGNDVIQVRRVSKKEKR